MREVKLETVNFLRIAKPIIYLLLEGTLHEIVTQVSIFLRYRQDDEANVLSVWVLLEQFKCRDASPQHRADEHHLKVNVSNMLAAVDALSHADIVDRYIDQVAPRPEVLELFTLSAIFGDDLLMLNVELSRCMSDQEYGGLFDQFLTGCLHFCRDLSLRYAG